MAGRTTREAWAKLRVNGVKVPRDLRKAESGFRKGGRRAGLAFRRGFRRVVGRLRGAAGMLGGIGIGVGIGAGLAKGLQEASQFEDQLQRLGSQARKFGSEMDVVRKSITKTSDETGLARSELTGALDEMVNLEGGSALTARNLETLAKGMQGTGTDGRELAQVMFTLGSNMKIAQDEMQGVLGGIDRIGTEASVPFSQLAASYTEVAAAASRMGVSGPQGVFQTVAAMQAMRKEITTPDEIKTSFTNLVTELLKKRKQIKRAFKIDVATGKGENTKLRDLFDIIQDFSQLDMSDAQRTLAITDVFGKRTAKGAIALLNNFKDFERFVSIGNEGAVEDFLGVRAQERAESAAGKLDAAINRLKLAFAEAFTPELIENVASAVGDVASGVNAAIDALRELKNFVSGDNTNDLVGDVGKDPRRTQLNKVPLNQVDPSTFRRWGRGINSFFGNDSKVEGGSLTQGERERLGLADFGDPIRQGINIGRGVLPPAVDDPAREGGGRRVQSAPSESPRLGPGGVPAQATENAMFRAVRRALRETEVKTKPASGPPRANPARTANR